MRYDEFRDLWEETIHDVGFRPTHHLRTELIDPTRMSRRHEFAVGHDLPQEAEPFHVTAFLSFDWNPFQSARSYAREEDLLTDLVGRHERLPRTAPRWIRMDIALRATLMQDAGVIMPEPKVLARWSKTVDAKLDKFLPHDSSFRGGRLVAMKGWRGELELESRCAADGRLMLNRVEVSAYQVVNPPRVLDDADRREKVKPIGKQLGDVARRYKRAFDTWMGCVGELRRSLDLPAVH